MSRPQNILLLSFLVIATGCSMKPAAVGDGGSLVVIADELDCPIIRKALDEKFSRMIATPHDEPLFEITWEDGNSIAAKTRSPLLLMASTLDGEGPTADLLKRMLTPEVEKGIRAGDFSIFKRKDPWARQQLMFILVGRDKLELGKRMEEWIDSLHVWAVDFEIKRLQSMVGKARKHYEYQNFIDNKHGFKLTLQVDYIEAQENDSLDFVRFIRHYPDRWIMIAWGRNGSELNPEFIYQRRKAAGEVFLDPIDTYNDHLTWEQTSFLGQPAIKIRGIWATKEPIGGGPFFTYGFTCPDNDFYYIIDCCVLAPGQTKRPFLWQLEALAHTFMTVQTDG